MRLQQELDQARAAPPPINFQQLDADRCQSVYYSYDKLAQADQTSGMPSSSYSHSSDMSSGTNSPSGRPGSARRTSRQQTGSGPSPSSAAGAASIGVRPGSSAARRTKELLQQAGLAGSVLQAAGASPPPGSQRSRPPTGAPGAAGPGSLRQWGNSGGLLGGVEQPVVPKARGLVRGSTDALKFTTRPASRGY